jgi:hypothetical protein
MVAAILAANIVAIGFIGVLAQRGVLLVLAFLMRVASSLISIKRNALA